MKEKSQKEEIRKYFGNRETKAKHKKIYLLWVRVETVLWVKFVTAKIWFFFFFKKDLKSVTFHLKKIKIKEHIYSKANRGKKIEINELENRKELRVPKVGSLKNQQNCYLFRYIIKTRLKQEWKRRHTQILSKTGLLGNSINSCRSTSCPRWTVK